MRGQACGILGVCRKATCAMFSRLVRCVRRPWHLDPETPRPHLQISHVFQYANQIEERGDNVLVGKRSRVDMICGVDILVELRDGFRAVLSECASVLAAICHRLESPELLQIRQATLLRMRRIPQIDDLRRKRLIVGEGIGCCRLLVGDGAPIREARKKEARACPPSRCMESWLPSSCRPSSSQRPC